MNSPIPTPRNRGALSLPSQWNVACHIDAENISPAAAQIGLSRIEEQACVAHILVSGRPQALRAYQRLNDGRHYHFDEIAPGAKGSQRTDNAVATEAALSASYHRFPVVAIFSSDGDFVECVSKLTRLNCHVIVVCEPHAPEALRRAASNFIEVSRSGAQIASAPRLDSVIRIVESVSRGEWVDLSYLGGYLQSVLSDFRYRDYGYTSLSDLLRAFPHRLEMRLMGDKAQVRSTNM